MTTVFIGGSRHLSRLSSEVKERLHNITSSGARVVIGDANGADKAVQKFLHDVSYKNVVVFCSGDHCRNNLGQWEARHIKPPKQVKGFDFYATKDREMAREADFGLMIWDGKSPGTVLNILRLIRANKKAVLLNVPDQKTTTFKASDDWGRFICQVGSDFRNDLRKRATPDEWMPPQETEQPTLLDAMQPSNLAARGASPPARTEEELAAQINAALATGDPASVVDALGNIAKARGMSQVAKDTGLARESLYRSLGPGGNPEFNTVLKVIASMGLRLMVGKAFDKAQGERP
jgi:probable addiction module antidote protein